MACPDVMEDLICGPTLGRPLADALQAVTDLEGPSLLNALFGRFQALQKGLRQVRSFGFGKGERLARELCGGSGHAKSIACGAKLVKSPESASVSSNEKSMGSARTNIKVVHRRGLLVGEKDLGQRFPLHCHTCIRLTGAGCPIPCLVEIHPLLTLVLASQKAHHKRPVP